MTEWPSMTLGEVCEEGGGFIRTGPFGAQLHQRDYTDDPNGIPVVMPKDMSRGRVDIASIARIDQATADRLAPHLLEAGDIALSRRGDVGRSAWIGPDDLPVLCGTGSMRIHPGMPRSVLPEYLRYFFRSCLAIDYLEAHAIGATMPNLNAAIVTEMPVPVLPLDRQRFAAGLLQTLDDLIANNWRRIKLLEQSARAIYREWFVHFRFPGHDAVDFVDSPVGPRPKAWALSTLASVLEVDKGLSYKGAFLTETGTCMANLKCFQPGGGFRRDGTKRYSGPFKDKHAIRPGDLIVANTDLTQAGTIIGSPAFVPREGFEDGGLVSHHLFAIRPRRAGLRHWLFGTFASDTFRNYARGVASGTTVLGFRPQDLLAFPVVVPDAGMLARYETIGDDLRGVAERLAEANSALASLRDFLLPILVAGRIDVSLLGLSEMVASVA